MSLVSDYGESYTPESLAEKIKKMISEQIGEDEISNTDNLVDDLSFDDLDLVELMMVIEEDFGISIDDEEMDECKTVSQVIELVSRKITR